MSKYKLGVIKESGRDFIESSQIMYIETRLPFSRLTLANNDTIELMLTIPEVEILLSEQGFFKLSDRFLVNLNYVEVVFPSNASKIIMENGKEIYVNFNRREELFEYLKEVYQLHELV